MPPPIMWLLASVVMFMVSAGAGYYYSKHKEEATPGVTAAKTGMYIAGLVSCIMMVGYVYTSRQAAKAAAGGATGTQIALPANASNRERSAADAEEKLRLAAGELQERAAVLNSRAAEASNIRQKEANLRSKFA